MRRKFSFVLIISMFAAWLPVFLPTQTYAQSVECSCVLALRVLEGVDIHGDAWTIRPNIQRSKVEPGDVVLFSYGHAALIQDVTLSQDGRIDIALLEYNFHSCQKDYRRISLYDSSIKGFYRPLPLAIHTIIPYPVIAV